MAAFSLSRSGHTGHFQADSSLDSSGSVPLGQCPPLAPWLKSETKEERHVPRRARVVPPQAHVQSSASQPFPKSHKLRVEPRNSGHPDGASLSVSDCLYVDQIC